MPIFLIFFAVIVLMIVFGVIGHQQAKKRREMLAAWAHASGLTFNPDKDRSFDDQFRLRPFRRGKGRYAYNLSHGERGGYRFIAGDYHYYTESSNGKSNSRTHHHFSFALFQPRFPLHKLAIRRESVFDKFTAAFGFDDIDFESAEFSKAFHVKGDDRKWTYDVIHPRTMELLLGHREVKIDSDVTALVITGPKKRWEISQLEHYANIATEFLDAIPTHARESY